MAAWFFVFDVRIVYAGQCIDELEYSNSFEKEFIRSDVVFSGIYQGIEKGAANFSHVEVYKAPDKSYFLKKTIEIHKGGITTSKEGAGKEFIIFASFDDFGRLIRRDCGLSHQTAESKIADIKRQEEGPISEREGDVVKLILTGRLASVQHAQGREIISKQKIRQPSHSIAEFRIHEMLRNQTERPHLEDIENIVIHATGCDNKLLVGHDYLVHAKKILIKRQAAYELFCHPLHLTDMHSKNILRNLSEEIRPRKESK